VRVIVGIDPGLDGAITFIDGDDILASVAVHIVPTLTAGKGTSKRNYDLPAMVALLTAHSITLAVIEQVSAAPVHGRVQGATSMFRFGQGYGIWLGMLAALHIPYQTVSPQTWKADVLKGTAKDKAAAITFCQRMFPGISLLASPRCKVPHDGIADALCLAEYGCRRFRKG
jgi:crossover junction endodeoxyribonuclease RuvC